MTWPNGDRYDGEWFEGKKHGFGTMWRCEHGKHRVEYNGTWVHNRRDGYGVMHNDLGETYEGEWRDGKRHGRGKQTYGGRFDGVGADVFDGEWVEGRRAGHGVMQLANGDLYEGEWLNDVKHGAGVYYYEAKGMKYDGVWERDTPKAGVYESIDPGDVPVVNLPALELMDAEQVGERAKRAALASLSRAR